MIRNLLDLVNEGNKVKKGYPSFWDAVANRDVDKMIKECVRNGLPERNKKIQERL